jgi:hypothetical protein
MSELLVGVGCGSLGILIGGLVALYIVETEKFNLGALTGSVSTLAGAGVIAVFHMLGGKDAPADPAYWVYPIGLLIGAAFIAALKGKI